MHGKFTLTLPLLFAAATPSILPSQQFEVPRQQHWETGGAQISELVVADFDLDGDLDLVTGGHLGNALYANDGRMRFGAGVGLPAQLVDTRALLAADFDGDGLTDLIAYGIGNNSYGDYLWHNVGGTLVPWGQLPFVYGHAHGYAAGDLDGDGDLDLVAARSHAGGAPNRVFRNDGNGVFTDTTAIGLGIFGSTMAVALGDVDGDGDLDAVFADYPQCTLWLGDGTGGFVDATNLLPIDQMADEDVALADLDGDGRLDIVFAAAFGQQRLYRNLGGGAFDDVTAGSLPAANAWTKSIAVGDVDGDGDLDLFFAISMDDDTLLLNDGSGTFTPSTANIGTFDVYDSRVVRLADLDGDSDLDLVVPSFDGFGSADVVYANVGSSSGVFVSGCGAAMPTLVGTSTGVACADFDGDGELDVVFAQESNNFGREATLLRGDGTGRFVDVSGAALPGDDVDASGVAVGDVDGDGDVDIVLACNGEPNRLYRNDGTGQFVNDVSFPADNDRTTCVALGDLDGDGDLDLVFGAAGGLSADPNRVYRNDGAAGFVDVSATHLPPLGMYSHAVALGDIEGDGDLDLVFANSGLGDWNGASNMLCVNDGSGHFTNVTGILMPTDATRSHAVAFVDLDGDGDLDLLFGNSAPVGSTGEANLFYRNDGSGAFTDATAQVLPAHQDRTMGLCCGDIDGDGDIDVLCANRFDPAANVESRLYRNDGNGVLHELPGDLPTLQQSGRAAVMVDVDHDDDLDIVLAVDYFGSSSQDRVLVNRLRSAHAPFLLRTGDDWPIELHAEPPTSGGLQFAVPALSTQRASAPIAMPFAGELLLDPAGIVLPAPMVLTTGDATFSLSIPASPSIVGIELLVQPLFLGGAFAEWGLGNLVAERIRD